MLSSGFITKVLEKVKNNKVSKEDIKKILFDVNRDKEMYEAIFNSMIEGVFVLDELNKIQYVNENALKMFNLELKSILDKELTEVLNDKDISHFFNEIQKSGKEIHNQEIDIGSFDNHQHIRVNFFPLKKGMEIIGNIFMLLDITHKKREQDKLRRAESLASLTTLAAGVAHEIKNPLSSIVIHIELLERYIEELPKKQQNNFNDIINIVAEEIDRLNRIISDFLFSVRPTILNKKLTNLSTLLNEILSLVSVKAEENGIKIILLTEENFPEIICDPNYIKNSFINIIKNSIEACEEGDEIEISLYREENNAVIQFQDTGKGISKDDLQKIFEPYYTTKDFGTGLGLTIVYKIIKEHNGDIFITSNKNDGTIFKITLPIYDVGVRLLEE